jgi:hypothetical protein
MQLMRVVTYSSFLATAVLGLAMSAPVRAEMAMPMNNKDMKWSPAPPMLPKGAKFTVVSGDPSKDGLYVVRMKVPAGYKIPAHNHPTAEYVTVISGTFNIGMGDKLDTSKGMALKASGFGEAPANMNHFAWASTPAEIQVHGQGPFAITYVNPADDPRKQ